MQAVFSAHLLKDETGMKGVAKGLKAACNTRWGDGSRIYVCVKPLVAGQTLSRMIGYVHKDRNLSTFHNRSKNVTEAMVQAGIEEHASLKLSYMDNKIMVTKSNLFQKAWSFWTNHKAPATLNFSQVITMLLNDGSHMLSASVLMNSNGQMRRSAAEVYWSLLMGHELTEFEVQQMLFLPKGPWDNNYIPNNLPPVQQDLFGSISEDEDGTPDASNPPAGRFLNCEPA